VLEAAEHTERGLGCVAWESQCWRFDLQQGRRDGNVWWGMMGAVRKYGRVSEAILGPPAAV